MVGELRTLLLKTIELVIEVTDDAAWDNPASRSRAGKEQAEEESRHALQTGSWPWLFVPMAARLALEVAIEETRGFVAVLDSEATCYAADVLCRAVLESSSLLWWLLDPDIGAEQRLARGLLYRLHTAWETQRAVDHLGLGEDAERSEYGQLPGVVEQEITQLGLGWTWSDSGRKLSWGDLRETWPSYTDRVGVLAGRIWPQPKLPYAVLSAVAHAELLGLIRNISPLRGEHRPWRLAPDPVGLWLWQNAYLLLGALMFTADRAADFLGKPDKLAALRA
jgi:hypothetical protein